MSDVNAGQAADPKKDGPTIAITGSTGHVGGTVARLLSEAGIPTRLIVRSPAKAPRLPDTEVAVAGYGDRDASIPALSGITTLFMVSAAESPDRLEQHIAFIDAAVAAGVEHIVYTSFVGASADATFTLARDHFHTEERIRATGRKFTILRDNFYLDFVADLVGDDDTIRGPAGDGRMAAVARADVAAVAAAVLQDAEAHHQTTYELTGPEAFSLADAAKALRSSTGRHIAYVEEAVDEAFASREKWRPDAWQAEAWVSTYVAIAQGDLARVSSDVESLIGRPPLSLRDVLS